MKVKKLNKNQVQKLQNETDDYCKKSGSGIGVKIIAGLSVVFTTVMLLVGCTTPEDNGQPYNEKNDVGVKVGSTFKEDLTMKNEKAFEKKLAQHLSEKTGLNVELYDITKVTLIRNEQGNVLSFENKAILTIQVSKERADAVEAIINNPGFRYDNEYSKQSLVYNDNYFSLEYGYELLNELANAVYDNNSKIISVFDKDATKFTYTYDGLAK